MAPLLFLTACTNSDTASVDEKPADVIEDEVPANEEAPSAKNTEEKTEEVNEENPVTNNDTMNKKTELTFPLELKKYDQNPSVTMKTSEGDVTLEIFTTQTPEVGGSFMTLAEAGAYDGSIFHRIIDGFVIQGGDYENGNGTGGKAYNGGMINDEIAEGLSNVVGTISMANRGLECKDESGSMVFIPDPKLLESMPNVTCSGTNGSQFFINQADNVFLDGKHSVFGKVTEGMDVVTKIAKMKKDGRDKPLEDVMIESVVVN